MVWRKITQGVCKLTTYGVNFMLLRKLCKETHCFLEKFTQLENFVHDRRLRQISSVYVGYMLCEETK